MFKNAILYSLRGFSGVVHAHRATLIKLQEFSQLTECLNTPRELGTVSEMPFHMLVLVKRSCSCILLKHSLQGVSEQEPDCSAHLSHSGDSLWCLGVSQVSTNVPRGFPLNYTPDYL